LTTLAARQETDTQVAKVLRQAFARNAEETEVTEEAIRTLGELPTDDQVHIAIMLLYGYEDGWTMREMLPIVREALVRHAAVGHPAFDEEELEKVSQSLGLIRRYTEAL